MYYKSEKKKRSLVKKKIKNITLPNVFNIITEGSTYDIWKLHSLSRPLIIFTEHQEHFDKDSY